MESTFDVKRAMAEKYHLSQLPQRSWYNMVVHRVKLSWYRYNLNFGGYVMTPGERAIWHAFSATVMICFLLTVFLILQALFGVGRNVLFYMAKLAAERIAEDTCSMNTTAPGCLAGMEYHIHRSF